VIPHFRMSYHPYGSFLSSKDSFRISLAGTTGYCGAVGQVGVKEGVIESKEGRFRQKFFGPIDDERSFSKFREKEVSISIKIKVLVQENP
jgi:hypothetical protein